MAGVFALEVRTHQVVDEDKNAGCLEDGADADDHVQDLPAAARLVGIYAARHAEQPGNVHEVEGEMKADEKKPEVPLAELLAHHPAGDLGVPVVEGAKERKQNRADQHVVEVRDHEVRVAQLPVEGSGREHDAGEPGDEELKQEADAEHHGHGEDAPCRPRSSPAS